MADHPAAPRLRLLTLITALVTLLTAAGVPARQDPPPPLPDFGGDPPFILPFEEPVSSSTWFVVQWYGNTTGAYRRRVEWYGGGQGLHFGVDFAARCGTPVLAIGEGVVLKVDAAEHGAGPHNLLILHDNGFVSLYGHLLEEPPFAIFTRVNQGAVIGKTGDPDLTCTSRPHLHLEVRDRSLYYGYNPVPFIDADWHSIALLVPRADFQRDLSDPRRWMTLEDQPIVSFGGPIINDYARPWPPGW